MTYDLLVSSASRPHLLRQVLERIFRFVDLPPARVIVHEDVVAPEWRGQTRAMLRAFGCFQELIVFEDEPPILHGPAMHRLLRLARTEFVLYAQDDDAPVRPVPIRETLAVAAAYGLNQVRFNKRQTMPAHRGWPKTEVLFPLPAETVGGGPVGARVSGRCPEHTRNVPLVLTEKFHFTFGLWRTAYVRNVADFWETGHPGSIREHGEAKLGTAMAGEIAEFSAWAGRTVEVPEPGTCGDPAVRRDVCRTYLYGRIGDPPFTEHLGWRSEDWRLPRANRSGDEERAHRARGEV